MIHAMRIKDGKATYVSRYVKTSRLKQEEYFGGAKFMKVTSIVWLDILMSLQLIDCYCSIFLTTAPKCVLFSLLASVTFLVCT